MILVTGVRFGSAGKIYYYEPTALKVDMGTPVVVDTANGEDIATIAFVSKKVEETPETELKQIIRIATKDDLDKQQKLAEKAKACLGAVKKKVKDFGLQMSIVDIKFAFDGSKVIVSFTSEDRVDFRDLLKDLGSYFKKRVELRQIGIRDETKLIGGLGVCGQPCCCKRFLDDFGHVSVKMAKNQGLSLNPTKISGLCGRLMCCLAYENEFYQEAQKDLPKIGGTISTPDGEGKLVSTNILKGTCGVKFVKGDETTLSNYNLCDISKCAACNHTCPAKQEHKEQKPQKETQNDSATTTQNSNNNQNPKKFKHKHKNKNKQNGEQTNGLPN